MPIIGHIGVHTGMAIMDIRREAGMVLVMVFIMVGRKKIVVM